MQRVLFTGVALLLLGLASCANGRKPTYPVTGKVLYNGKPVAHATVVFHPVGEIGPDVLKPRGKVSADGSFKLTTYDGDDGAPAGDYQVTVELWLATGRPEDGPTSRLPPRYANPASSNLTAVVTAGPTNLQPFELKR